jgi:hypothetical protein|tara:strand:- start:1404 stop:1568 length:165 start_codon:yes stop_codon:yes gene_type:complete
VDRRSTVDVKGYLKKLNDKVDVDELMESEMEKQFMAILLELVEGKVKSIGNREI